MQNDFITGSLGTENAISVLPKVINKAKTPYAVNACDGSVIIEGGIFEGLISGNVVIKGGTFSENPNLPDTAEYEAKENVDGYWVVVKKES